ncbi:hypothetical protein TgHK011_002103 [Trichoderma gracile]|nr:hypothetical protein TgHK011_002103 [Trichoderma gracile]
MSRCRLSLCSARYSVRPPVRVVPLLLQPNRHTLTQFVQSSAQPPPPSKPLATSIAATPKLDALRGDNGDANPTAAWDGRACAALRWAAAPRCRERRQLGGPGVDSKVAAAAASAAASALVSSPARDDNDNTDNDQDEDACDSLLPPAIQIPDHTPAGARSCSSGCCPAPCHVESGGGSVGRLDGVLATVPPYN